MSKLIFLNICLFCVLSIVLADLNKPVTEEANKTTVINDKKMIILDAKPVLKSSNPNARDLKQSESHVGILYPHLPHFHHGYHHHGYHHHGYHHGYHHYPYHKFHHLHFPFFHHFYHPYLHHHHYHSHYHKHPYHGHYPHYHHHYPYYGYIHFFNIYGLNFSPYSLLNYPLYHLKRPIHSPHNFLPYLNHNKHCRCECCSKPLAYGMKPPMHHSFAGHHTSKSKPYHDLPIHSLNGNPINNHPLNNPSFNGHHPYHLNENAMMNGHSINGQPMNGQPINGHSIPLHLQRPHYKINSDYETTAHESYKSPKFNSKEDKKIDKTIDKDSTNDYAKLPPNELMNQLVDFDTSYLLPKHDHPALHSLMEDRYRRLIYGQFFDRNPTYLYEPLPSIHSNDEFANKHNNKPIQIKNSINKQKSNKKLIKKDSEHLQLKNGGQMHLIKMGIIK